MKVYAKNQDMVKLLRHPVAGGFLNLETPAEWPDDSFTYRRMRDGDITDKPPEEKVVPAADAPTADAPAASSDASPEAASAEVASAPVADQMETQDSPGARRRKS
jgi:hypothetical protein